MPRRLLWLLVLSIAVTALVAAYFTQHSLRPSFDLDRFLPKQVRMGALTGGLGPTEESPADGRQRPVLPEFYEWKTVTLFKHVDQNVATRASHDHLCKSFPDLAALGIQPVLKTGHGVLNTRVKHSLSSTSACLSKLLIFSDLPEMVGGNPVIDVLSDIPWRLIKSTGQTKPYRKLLTLNANESLKDQSMTATDGWKTDKFKFFPSISRAWMMAPEKRWYVFYEGDTYVFWDTVTRLLTHFDPDIPHYFGSPSPGRAWFGNGGPGFILSRAAMKRLVQDDWDRQTGEWLGSKLAEKYWKDIINDCCGDSVLGYVLDQKGIKLEGLWPSFNPHPLHGIPFADRYWCQPVLSLHKTFDKDVEKLWRWEWVQRKPFRPVTYRDLGVAYFNFTANDVKMDWDNGEWDAYEPNPDDPQSPHDSYNHCRRGCTSDEGCFQWTYHARSCWYVRSFRHGRQRGPSESDRSGLDEQDRRFVAGWDTIKIKKWMEARPCEDVQWVRPSTERIF